MNESVYNAIEAAAKALGREHGEALATNFATRENAREIIHSVEMDDHIDGIRSLDLSGEWADSTSPRDVLDRVASAMRRASAVGNSGLPDHSDYLDEACLDPDTGDAFVTAYENAYNHAADAKAYHDALEILRDEAFAEIGEFALYELSTLADCAHPGANDSAGAVFLFNVRAATIDSLKSRDCRLSFEEAAFIADRSPDYRPAVRWQEFVDLKAYDVDVTDKVSDGSDLTACAGAALYIIAERLALAIAERVESATETDEDEEPDFSESVDELRTAQGWTDASLLMLALEFVRDRHNEEEFLAHLSAHAESENEA